MKYLRRVVGKTRRDRIRNVRIKEEVKVKKKISSKEMTGKDSCNGLDTYFV